MLSVIVTVRLAAHVAHCVYVMSALYFFVMVLRSWRSQPRGSAGALGSVAETMLTRSTPPGFILPVTLPSLLTTLSGQLGFQLGAPVLPSVAAGTVSGAPLARLARMTLSPSVAMSAALNVPVKPSMPRSTTL